MLLFHLKILSCKHLLITFLLKFTLKPPVSTVVLLYYPNTYRFVVDWFSTAARNRKIVWNNKIHTTCTNNKAMAVDMSVAKRECKLRTKEILDGFLLNLNVVELLMVNFNNLTISITDWLDKSAVPGSLITMWFNYFVVVRDHLRLIINGKCTRKFIEVKCAEFIYDKTQSSSICVASEDFLSDRFKVRRYIIDVFVCDSYF